MTARNPLPTPEIRQPVELPELFDPVGTEADIVGDEEVSAGQLERLHQRRELVGHQLDACPKRRRAQPHNAPT